MGDQSRSSLPDLVDRLREADDPETVDRLTVAVAHAHGVSPPAIAERRGVPEATVREWIDRVAADGVGLPGADLGATAGAVDWRAVVDADDRIDCWQAPGFDTDLDPDDLSDLFEDGDDATAAVERAREAGRERFGGRLADGTPVEVRVVAAEDGVVLYGMVVEGWDRRAEELQRRVDRLEDLTSMISHDLRNPLMVAQGCLDLYREEREDRHLKRIERAQARMEDLIDDMVEMARQDRTVDELEPVAIDEVSEDAWATVADEGADLCVETDRTVLADRSRLRQIFENLFHNSVEHGSTDNRNSENSGDSVEHGSTSSRNPEDSDGRDQGATDLTVWVGATDDGFFVADDGSGIPPGEREQVFESGYSTGPEGTGFGLAIVETIAEAHGWTVELTESREGGARFDFFT